MNKNITRAHLDNCRTSKRVVYRETMCKRSFNKDFNEKLCTLKIVVSEKNFCFFFFNVEKSIESIIFVRDITIRCYCR